MKVGLVGGGVGVTLIQLFHSEDKTCVDTLSICWQQIGRSVLMCVSSVGLTCQILWVNDTSIALSLGFLIRVVVIELQFLRGTI